MKYEVASDKTGTAGYDNVNKNDLQEMVIYDNNKYYNIIFGQKLYGLGDMHRRDIYAYIEACD